MLRFMIASGKLLACLPLPATMLLTMNMLNTKSYVPCFKDPGRFVVP